MKLECITVNYRTEDLTLRVVRALVEALEGHDARITIVENGSGNSAAERLREGLQAISGSTPTTLIVSEVNGGFGAGNNLALRAALGRPDPPDVFYLINPDALPDPGSVAALLGFLERHPRAGVVGTGVRDLTGPHSSAFRFPTAPGEFEGRLRLGAVSRLLARWRIPLEPGGAARRVDWVSGSSCALRRAMLEEVGLFDESFFLYFEETDLCRRAAPFGWEVWTVPESEVLHEGAVATGLEDRTKRRPAFWFESRSRYLLKHDGWRGLVLANLAWVVGSLFFELRRRLTARPRIDPPRLLWDFVTKSWWSRAAR